LTLNRRTNADQLPKFCGNYGFELAGQFQVKDASNAPAVFTPHDTANRWQRMLRRDAVPGPGFHRAS
jgi:hypothetical protein